MSLTQNTLGLGRVGIKKVYEQEAKLLRDISLTVLGNKYDTKQTYEVMKSIAPFAPAVQTAEGAVAAFDDMIPLFVRNFYPLKYTKGVKISFETELTDQYGIIKGIQKQIAKSFVARKNQVAANINNNGFTGTTDGMNNESLYTTAHSMTGGLTGSNRPAIDIGFAPLAVEQCLQELRAQKNARGIPMGQEIGKVLITVPTQLEGMAYRTIHSEKLGGTSNNDLNWSRERVTYEVIDYYTSSTAWFARAFDNDEHGLFLLEQAPYDIKKLSDTTDMMTPWIAWEIYCAGWVDWHGTWGTVGQ